MTAWTPKHPGGYPAKVEPQCLKHSFEHRAVTVFVATLVGYGYMTDRVRIALVDGLDDRDPNDAHPRVNAGVPYAFPVAWCLVWPGETPDVTWRSSCLSPGVDDLSAGSMIGDAGTLDEAVQWLLDETERLKAADKKRE